MLTHRIRRTAGLRFIDVELDVLNAMQQMNNQWIAGTIEEGVYRQKGNRFRDLIIALIQSRCGVELKERRVKGLTDLHTIDIVYPEGGDPILACEVKMLGTPSHTLADGTTKPERGGAVDLDKRLKEVKYIPIDLKLEYTGTNVGDWRQWVKRSKPKFFSVWACYIGQREKNRMNGMLRKFEDLRAYYNDGVGLLFYERGPSRGYQRVINPALDAFAVDNVIEQICEILSGASS